MDLTIVSKCACGWASHPCLSVVDLDRNIPGMPSPSSDQILFNFVRLARQTLHVQKCLIDTNINYNSQNLTYRSRTVNSKSFIGKVLLRIKWKFELTMYFKHEILGQL